MPPPAANTWSTYATPDFQRRSPFASNVGSLLPGQSWLLDPRHGGAKGRNKKRFMATVEMKAPNGHCSGSDGNRLWGTERWCAKRWSAWCERPGPITGPMQTRVLHQLVKMGRHLRQSHATRPKGRMGKGTCGEAEHREMERGVCE